jgi:hypothetical protein
MNPFHCMKPLISLFFMVLAFPALAEEKPGALETETFGQLKLGRKAADIVKVLGQPEGKGKEVHWDATGDWVQEWRYPAKGLTLNMASAKKGAPKTVLSFTAEEGCKLATSRGIKLGSTLAEVRKAYGKFENKEDSQAGETFVAGSVYGGIIFHLKDGKVSSIFFGAAAE